jgi:peptidoglycan/LPS O-acetylase OafA/YrhL
MPTQRIDELDSVRGLAALSVAFAHSSAVFAISGNREFWATELFKSSPPVAFFRIASSVSGVQIAVLLFFVLSGFVLTKSLQRHEANWLTYPWRRVVRLMPALIVSILVSWVTVNTLFVEPSGINSVWFSGLFGRPFDVSDVIGNIFLLNSTVNNVTWTIGAELVCSSLLPILIIMSRRLNIVLITGGFALLTIIGHPSFAYYGYCFALGAMLATFPGKRIPSVVVVVTILIVWYMPFNVSLGAYRNVILITACGIIVYWVSERRPSILRNYWLRNLGAVSYSFYLIHPAVLYATAVGFIKHGWNGTLHIIGLFLVSSILAYLSAILLFQLVERPSIKFSRGSKIFLRESDADVKPKIS